MEKSSFACNNNARAVSRWNSHMPRGKPPSVKASNVHMYMDWFYQQTVVLGGADCTLRLNPNEYSDNEIARPGWVPYRVNLQSSLHRPDTVDTAMTRSFLRDSTGQVARQLTQLPIERTTDMEFPTRFPRGNHSLAGPLRGANVWDWVRVLPLYILVIEWIALDSRLLYWNGRPLLTALSATKGWNLLVQEMQSHKTKTNKNKARKKLRM